VAAIGPQPDAVVRRTLPGQGPQACPGISVKPDEAVAREGVHGDSGVERLR